MRVAGNTHCQRRQEARDLCRPHVGGMALAVEKDVAADPRDIRLLGAAAIVAGADRFADSVEEPWLRRTGLVGLADGERRNVPDVHGCGIPHWTGRLKGDHARVPPPIGYDDTPSTKTRRHRAARSVPTRTRPAPILATRVCCRARPGGAGRSVTGRIRSRQGGSPAAGSPAAPRADARSGTPAVPRSPAVR